MEVANLVLPGVVVGKQLVVLNTAHEMHTYISIGESAVHNLVTTYKSLGYLYRWSFNYVPHATTMSGNYDHLYILNILQSCIGRICMRDSIPEAHIYSDVDIANG